MSLGSSSLWQNLSLEDNPSFCTVLQFLPRHQIACNHSCCECQRSNEPSRLLQALVHVCDCSCWSVHRPQNIGPTGAAPNRGISGRLDSKHLTILPTVSQFLSLELMTIDARCADFRQLLDVLVCQFAVPFKALLCVSFHFVGLRNGVLHHCLRTQTPRFFFRQSCRTTRFEHFPAFVDKIWARLALALNASENTYTWLRNVVWLTAHECCPLPRRLCS